jgi:quercetin dioxygenase-like cupin family protein
MPIIAIDSIGVREIFPGVRARIVHTERTSQSWVELDEGGSFPLHQHPHEQSVNVLDGTLELVVDGQTCRVTTGQTFVIPPNVPHAGRALTACRVLDVFAPARDDYR